MPLQFGVLGPLVVRSPSGPIALPGARNRRLLAALVLERNRPVSADGLAATLWGEDASHGSGRAVRVQVSRLRAALGTPDVIVTTPGGYQLCAAQDDVDADRFEALLVDGRAALSREDLEGAAVRLRAALALWRGPVLGEFGGEAFVQSEANRLEELRLVALELRVEAELQLGGHRELVPELQSLVARHPLREGLHAQLMLALYRCGRQPDALAVYRQLHKRLRSDLGLEASPALRDLEHAILSHDTALREPPVAGVGSGMGDRRPRLPAPPNRTIGRARDLAIVVERLRAGPTRLLTLTGPGGVGKTRLALEAARRAEPAFADGARFVALETVRRPEDVPTAIATELAAVPLAGESAEEAAERLLGHRELLLVLDNCEHVLGMAAFIARLLAACPGVTVLATSREPLGLHAEQRHLVPPLTVDPTPGPRPGGGGEAAALFAERARARDPEFELDETNATAVADICRRLDGLPLAIELAAARCGLLTAPEIAARLRDALASPGHTVRDAPARHQTLRAAIDWSHDLLDPEEASAFARFAVFAGGATLPAAEAITAASLDTLERLAAKSLLVRRRQPDGQTRLTMLDTVRAYAGEHLNTAPDADTIRERHYRHYVALVERHGTERALWGRQRRLHLAVLDTDSANLLAARDRAIECSDAACALTLCSGLALYLMARGRHAEALAPLEQALALPQVGAEPALLSNAMSLKAWLLWPAGRGAERDEVMAHAERLARRHGDPRLLAQVLLTRSAFAAQAERRADAAAFAEEALRRAREAGADWETASATARWALTADTAGDLRRRVDDAAELLERVGNVHQLAMTLTSASYVALVKGSARDADAFARRAIAPTLLLDDDYQWTFLCGNRGLAALFTGDLTEARAAFQDELELCLKLMALPLAGEGLLGLAAVAALKGDAERAARLEGAARTHRYQAPPDAVTIRLATSYLRPLRDRHGRAAWDAATRAGAALSFEDAIAYAVDDARPAEPLNAYTDSPVQNLPDRSPVVHRPAARRSTDGHGGVEPVYTPSQR